MAMNFTITDVDFRIVALIDHNFITNKRAQLISKPNDGVCLFFKKRHSHADLMRTSWRRRDADPLLIAPLIDLHCYSVTKYYTIKKLRLQLEPLDVPPNFYFEAFGSNLSFLLEHPSYSLLIFHL